MWESLHNLRRFLILNASPTSKNYSSSVFWFYNWECVKIRQPSSSFSWRSSTMNVYWATSPPCRRAGVLHTSELLNKLLFWVLQKSYIFKWQMVVSLRESMGGKGGRDLLRNRWRQSIKHGGTEGHLQDTPQVNPSSWVLLKPFFSHQYAFDVSICICPHYVTDNETAEFPL